MVMENVSFNTADGNAVVIERRFKLLIVDIWNLTQQWDSINNESCETLNRLTNNRMYLTFQSDSTSLKQEEIVRDAEKLSDALARFENIYKKIQKAQSTIPSLRQIANGDLRTKVDELYDLFPSLVKMYEKELGFKKASLIDVGSHDNSDLFSAILSSWNLSLFIDKSVTGRLYALTLEVIILEATAYPTAQEVLEVLEDENVPLSFWPDIALGYYRLKRYDEFVFLLEKAEKKKTDQTKDQMRCMDLLAAYYVKKGRSFRNEKDRKEYFSKATVLYTTADKLMMYDVSHLIGRAYFCLLEAVKSGQAKAQFDYVINYRPSDTSAIIGRALENYASGEYEASLAFFRKALKMKPDLPAEVRLGFGHCFLKLKNYGKAKAAFNRVAILDPKNISARVALAVCYFHDGDTEIAEKALASCHNVDSSNPVILNQLANVYFLTNQNEKAEEIAWSAYNSSVQKDLKAESCFLIARCHHRKREHDKAFRYYYQASQFGAPKFVLPFYGLGQIHLGRAEFDQAIDCFEKVLKEYPEDYETLKVLGSIYTRWQGPIEDDKIRESQRKGEELLRKVIEMNPEDYEVILELAQLQESTRPAEALKKYEKACAILEADENFEVPSELYCNIGALHYQLGHYEKSKTYFEKAEELLQSKNGSLLGDENEAKLITVQYNLGRLYEALSRFEIAEEFYNEILTQKPNHMDSFVRLGCIYRERGDTTKSIEYYNKAISADENCDVPYLYMANLNVSLNKIKEAQQTFETVLKLRDHKDNAYALVGLGNVWLEALFSVKRGDQDEKEKMTKFRDHAMNCYLKVLKHHPHNAWAVNGVGCVLAHKGQTQDARELYSQVREAAPELNDVFLNLAHIHMDNRQYSVALQMYKSIMKRQKRQFDIQLLQYAARAAWKCNNWSECRDLLQRAILEAPANLLLRFSLAIVLQCTATHIMREEKATVEEFAGAVEDYKIAEKTFVYLSQQPDEIMSRYRYISRQVCKSEAGVCKDLLAQAKQLYKSAYKKEAEEKEKQDRIKALREEQIRIRQEEERQQLLKQQELEAELRKQRAFYVEKTKEILKVSQVVEEKEEKTKKKSGGRRKKNKDEDDFLNDSDEGGQGRGGDGEERIKKKKEKRRKRKREDVEGGGGSGSEGENKAPKKKRKAEKKPVVEEEPVRKGKVKSRAYVSSSSSSESDNENGGTSQPQRIVSGDEEAPPAISDDSDLSDSPKKNESDEEDESPSKPVKRARIEDSDDDDDEDDEETAVLATAGSPAESEEHIKPPDSDSD